MLFKIGQSQCVLFVVFQSNLLIEMCLSNQICLLVFAFCFQPPRFAQNLYDAIMFYAVTVNSTINKGQNYRDGMTVIKNMKNKVYASKRLCSVIQT